MKPRINKNKTEKNENNKNLLLLNNRYHLNKNFRSMDNNNIALEIGMKLKGYFSEKDESIKPNDIVNKKEKIKKIKISILLFFTIKRFKELAGSLLSNFL